MKIMSRFLFLLLTISRVFISYASHHDDSHLEIISPNLILGKTAEGVFLGFHRIDNDPKAKEHWRHFRKHEEAKVKEYHKLLSSTLGEKDPEVPKIGSKVTAGFSSWEFVLDLAGERWIAYVARRREIDPFKLGRQDIEMVVTACTSQGAPMTHHMGINRGISYMIERLKASPSEKDQFPMHRNLSAMVHAFAAKCMLQRHPEKLYMITFPEFMAGYLVKKALPTDAYFWQEHLSEADDNLEINLETKFWCDLNGPWQRFFKEAETKTTESERKDLKDQGSRVLKEACQKALKIMRAPIHPVTSPYRNYEGVEQVLSADRETVLWEYNSQEHIIRFKGLDGANEEIRGSPTIRESDDPALKPFEWFIFTDRTAGEGDLVVNLRPLAATLNLI